MPRRRAIPKAMELREWTLAEINRVDLRLYAEVQRRRRVTAAAELKERERLQKIEADRLARTVVRKRYIQQKVKCGRQACHCMKGGSLHGGYWYRIDTFGDGRRSKTYIGKKKPSAAAAA